MFKVADMDYHYFKTKLNLFYSRFLGNTQRPTFYDIHTVCPQLNTITANFKIIKQEFEAVLSTIDTLPQYHDIDPGEADISNACTKKWNVFMLYLLGYQLKESAHLCPELCHLLKSIPNLIQAFFSILEPGKSIPLHEGPYLGYLRYHLGIHIPQDNPPQIIVNRHPYTWKEGEAVLFDDFWPHEVQNFSSDYRAVLIIDVLRPLPFLPHIVNLFVTRVIAKYFYGRPVMKKAIKHNQAIIPLHQ